MIFKSRIIYNIVLSWVLKWNIIVWKYKIRIFYYCDVLFNCKCFKKIINYMLNVYFCIVEGWIW